jgi:hypothetical protein
MNFKAHTPPYYFYWKGEVFCGKRKEIGRKDQGMKNSVSNSFGKKKFVADTLQSPE